MKTKRFLQLTHAMCEQAVLEAFDKKWFRRDYLATVEKYGGVSRAELSRAARLNDWNPRLEAVNSIALEMEQRVEDLVEGETDDLDLEPVSVFYRIDGISMKRRELSNCHPMHQAFGHLAVIGLRPLLRAKLLPYQFASIPGKGQIALKRQVERWLRRKSLGIQHAVKLDVQGAYLARATGIRPTTISDYYNEIAERMNLNHLDLICEALDCEPDEILVRVPNPEPRVRNRTGFEKPATESKVGI